MIQTETLHQESSYVHWFKLHYKGIEYISIYIYFYIYLNIHCIYLLFNCKSYIQESVWKQQLWKLQMRLRRGRNGKQATKKLVSSFALLPMDLQLGWRHYPGNLKWPQLFCNRMLLYKWSYCAEVLQIWSNWRFTFSQSFSSISLAQLKGLAGD